MKETRAEYLPIEKLKPFEGHPFKVTDNEEMDQLTWSILTQGLLTPLIVRPLPNGEYEVISGHRRLHACKKAGIEKIPAFVCSKDRSEAVVAMVDSNLHREKLLPSEKAFAYKMKMDAMKHQGTSSQLGTKQRTDALIAAQAITIKDSSEENALLREELNKYHQKEEETLRRKNQRKNILRFIWSIVWKLGILGGLTVVAVCLENECNSKIPSYIAMVVNAVGLIYTLGSALKKDKEKYLKDYFETKKKDEL